MKTLREQLQYYADKLGARYGSHVTIWTTDAEGRIIHKQGRLVHPHHKTAPPAQKERKDNGTINV